MPTSLTEKIETGEITELADLAMVAARQMGFLIHMRDDPLNAPIIRRRGWYYDEHSVKYRDAAKEKLEAALARTDEEWQQACQDSYDEKTKRGREVYIKDREIFQRYKVMEEKVEAWDCPGDLLRTKELMLEQIRMCMKDPDRAEGWMKQFYFPVLESWQKFKQDEIKILQSALQSAEASVAREESNIRMSDYYLDLLTDSLGLERIPE